MPRFGLTWNSTIRTHGRRRQLVQMLLVIRSKNDSLLHSQETAFHATVLHLEHEPFSGRQRLSQTWGFPDANETLFKTHEDPPMNLARILPCAISAALVLAPALYASKQKPIDVRQVGTTSMAQAHTRATATASAAMFLSRPKVTLKPMRKPVTASPLARTQASRSMPSGIIFGGYPVVAPDKSFSGFDALDSTDSGMATGFVVEPPDQGLATNGDQVLEVINLAIQAFTKAGKPLVPPVSLYSFFDVPTAPNMDGTSNQLSDPRGFYDWESGRWFVTVLEYATTSDGALTGGSRVLIAVSGKSDVLSSYTINAVDTSDANYGDCPCLGDQPLLGINQDGVYLNTNEFSDSTGGFQTTLVTAISKRDLIEGASTVTAAGFDGLTLAEGVAFSIQPAFPSPGTKTNENGGTEFFTSSLDFNNSVDNRVAVWSLTNTKSLQDNVPSLNLQQTIINTEEYGAPVPAVQRSGTYPLGQSLGDAEEKIDTGDDRMMQLFYSQGRLFCALNTLLLDPNGGSGPRTGAAWFAIQPKASPSSLSAKIWKQGLIGIKNGSVMYPAFAVSGSGDGVIAFSLTGENYFPSTGYVSIHGGTIQPKVYLAGIGQAPDDGFSGYPQYGGAGVGRWGDYSAAMVSPNGDLWMASEYIPNSSVRPRTRYTNWGTFIYQVH